MEIEEALIEMELSPVDIVVITIFVIIACCIYVLSENEIETNIKDINGVNIDAMRLRFRGNIIVQPSTDFENYMRNSEKPVYLNNGNILIYNIHDNIISEYTPTKY